MRFLKELFLESCPETVGLRRCNFSTHGGSADLEIVFTIVLKIVFVQNKFQELKECFVFQCEIGLMFDETSSN